MLDTLQTNRLVEGSPVLTAFLDATKESVIAPAHLIAMPHKLGGLTVHSAKTKVVDTKNISKPYVQKQKKRVKSEQT